MKKFILLLPLLLLPACTPSGTGTEEDTPQEPADQIQEDINPFEDTAFTAEEQELIETYIEEHIGELSTVEPVLGGTFYVTNILWQDDDSVIVEYEDGHIAETAYAEPVINDDGTVTVGAFLNVEIPDQAEADEDEATVEETEEAGE